MLSIWKTGRMTAWEICRGTMEPDQSEKEDCDCIYSVADVAMKL